jgi:hypothetical protein
MQVFKKLLRNRVIVVLVSMVMLLGLIGGVQVALRFARAAAIDTNAASNSGMVHCNHHVPCDFLSSTGFGTTQGQNGWEYLYSVDGDVTFAQMSFIGPNSSWQGSETDCLVGAGWQHPGASACDSVRTWVAPQKGNATVTANGAVTVAGGCIGSTNTAGVQIRVLQNGTQIWPASGWQVIPNGQSFTFPTVTTSVSSGDQLQFVVEHAGSMNSCDTTTWDQDVSLA